MRPYLLCLVIMIPALAQAPTTWKSVRSSDGTVYQVPDMYEELPYGEFPVRSMMRTSLADFPAPSQFTRQSWTPANEQTAIREIVDLADGGRLAAEVISGPIDKKAWPHEDAARAWFVISAETKASGQSIFTAQERWLQRYWDWWHSRAKVLAQGVDVEKSTQVRNHFGDDAPLTHWRCDLIQRSRQWAKADQAVRRGLPPPSPALLSSQMERSLTEFYQR